MEITIHNAHFIYAALQLSWPTGLYVCSCS